MNDEQQIIEPVPTMAGYKKIPTFKLWIANQFPYIETDFDAITNYELLQAVIKYLNTIIENENNVESNVTALYNSFVNLHDYVENYFDNLDVQEEINNKLDKMVEDGTIQEILGLLYPVKDGETNVVSTMYPYGDIYRYGVKADSITDDTIALQNTIDNALLLKTPVYLHGIIYVTDSIDCKGVKMIGDNQPKNSGASYPNGIGWDYPKNVGNGSLITFRDYITDIVKDTAIISDVANPILKTDYNKQFDLENFGVYGWLRNNNQEGLKVIPASTSVSYYNGGHRFKNFSVFNTGSNAIHLYSLETAEINNLIIELCNNYGLYIEGLAGIDTPVDYTKFENCRIRYTRLAGIKLYNSFRQLLIISHCNFNFIGQYGFGVCNDIFGERILPTDNDNVIPAIDIDGLNSVNAGQGRNIELKDTYGEGLLGMLKIRNINTIQNCLINDCSIVRVAGTTDSNPSYFINIVTNYLLGYNSVRNITNVTSPYLLSVNNRISTYNDMLSDTLYEQFKNKFFIDSNRQGNKTFNEVYLNNINAKEYTLPRGRFTALVESSNTDRENVEVDISSLVNKYFKDNYSVATGQPYTLAIISNSHAGNAAAGAKCDLIAITKHSDKIFITFITNNLNATADTTGKITLNVPAYRRTTIQFIQQIDTTLG